MLKFAAIGVSSVPQNPASIPTAPITAAAVEAPRHVQQAPLDLTQARWPEAMIHRIEMLRDMADANDMRIRVVPDALGAIDIALKRDGDTVQVQLHAQQPQTRAMLAEAQPRLAELAEARGIKLQQQSTTGGSAGTGAERSFASSQQQQQQQQQQRPSAPPSAFTSPARRRDPVASAGDTDQRIA